MALAVSETSASDPVSESALICWMVRTHGQSRHHPSKCQPRGHLVDQQLPSSAGGCSWPEQEDQGADPVNHWPTGNWWCLQPLGLGVVCYTDQIPALACQLLLPSSLSHHSGTVPLLLAHLGCCKVALSSPPQAPVVQSMLIQPGPSSLL